MRRADIDQPFESQIGGRDMCVSFSDFPFLQIGHFLAFSCVSSFSSFCSRPLFIYCSHVTIVRFLALIY